MLRSVDNDVAKRLVIVPGWAFDGRVFAGLDWPGDCHVFDADSAADLTGGLRQLVSRLEAGRVSLLGWSQGGFAVCEFAGRHPELVEEVVLVGMRRRYDGEELAEMRRNLERNRVACLKRFYRRCFAKEEMAQYQWFRRTLLEDYLERMLTEQLIHDLDWLGRAEVRIEDLRQIERVRFVHGAADAVAPIAQVIELVECVPEAELIRFEQAGHLPFRRDDFTRRVYEH